MTTGKQKVREMQYRHRIDEYLADRRRVNKRGKCLNEIIGRIRFMPHITIRNYKTFPFTCIATSNNYFNAFEIENICGIMSTNNYMGYELIVKDNKPMVIIW